MSRNKTQTKSLRRSRRLEQAELERRRRRERRVRSEIHVAMKHAKDLVLLAGSGDWHLPYRALDKKTDRGWVYVDALDHEFYETSRDKARAAVKRFNELPPITLDSAMETYGWRQVADTGHVEQRFERVTDWTSTIDTPKVKLGTLTKAWET